MEYTDPCDDCTHWLGKLFTQSYKITVYKHILMWYNSITN